MRRTGFRTVEMMHKPFSCILRALNFKFSCLVNANHSCKIQDPPLEEIVQIHEKPQRRRQQQNPNSSDQNFDDSSDLELFFNEEDEEYHDESCDEEAAAANQAQLPQNAVYWSPWST